MCDIVLLVYDQLSYTKDCVESILNNTDCPFKLLIIDNGSVKEETVSYLDDLAAREKGRVLVHRIPQNIGYVRAVNHGLSMTSGEYVCVISNDTLVYPGWLSEMIETARRDPLIGVVNPLWMVPKRFLGSRDEYFSRIVTKQKGTYIETDWARGFCFLVTRNLLEKIPGLDEAYAPGYFDDWDYSVRAIKAGFRCACALGAFVWHYKNVTYGLKFSTDSLRQKGRIFYGRWGAPIKILLIDDQNGRPRDFDFPAFIRELLNSQNRVAFATAQNNHAPAKHTNLCCRHVPGFWLKAYAVFKLFDNLRYHESKRYDMIISSGNMSGFLQRVSVIKKRYTGRFYPIDGQQSGLLTEVDSLKKKKAQGLI